jgi:hypothetical protein
MALSSLNSQIVINEYSVSNLESFTDNYGSYEDWFEIYNTSGAPVDIGNYYLSDRVNNNTKWQFPVNTIIASHGYLKIWVTGRNEVSGNNYHTNFKLTQTRDNPEYIVISDAEANILDSLQLEITQQEHSRGRTSNGSENWSVFTNPTPGSSNNNAINYDEYAMKPEMSEEAGFYDNEITVTITNYEPNSVVKYTTDGSEPTLSSATYTDPIEINSTQIVIARVFSNNSNILPSLLTFHTYFINESHNMGVMSLSAEQLDNLLNGNGSLRPFGTFEYFNEDGERTTFGYGEFNEHGQDSWVHDQRSIDYISRDECGYNYAIREQLIPSTDRDEYQRVILRAAGDDNYPGIDTSAHLRDYFVQNTAHLNDMHLDVRKGQKGVIYCNGIYWGVYGYREKVTDHDFTNYYYDQGKYDIYYLKLWGGSWAEYGGQAAWDDWNDLHGFILNNDMGIQENYEYVKTRLDYKSLVDYILMNSFVVCSDWINWNVGWWRGTNPDGGHQKWGYTLWDEDATFAHYINYTGVPGISPYTSPCYPEGLTSDPEQHIVMLNELLENDEFYEYYVTRYIDLYNTTFIPNKMIDYLEEIEDRMAPEMPQHVARWGGTVNQWENNVQKIKNFVSARHSYLPTGLNECYNLNGPYELTVNVQPSSAGQIIINSYNPENWYFGGNYFGGINTTLQVLETNPYFKFSHWESYVHEFSPTDTAQVVTLDLTTDDYITAVFEQVELSDSLVINEINYNSADNFDTRDWVEFYNPQDYEINISGWEFKDSDDAHIYEFPENTIIEPDGYLVLVRDSADFQTFQPDITNFIGEFDFGLSAEGELIRLYDSTGALIDTVHYGIEYPWPFEPNGNGPTLELIDWEYDNALPESWLASSENGTPGAINSNTVNIPEPQTIKAKLSFVVYPNPATSKTIFKVTTGDTPQNAELILYNIFGLEVKRISHISSNHVDFQVDDLSAGSYLVKLVDNQGLLLGTRKIMIK